MQPARHECNACCLPWTGRIGQHAWHCQEHDQEGDQQYNEDITDHNMKRTEPKIRVTNTKYNTSISPKDKSIYSPHYIINHRLRWYHFIQTVARYWGCRLLNAHCRSGMSNKSKFRRHQKAIKLSVALKYATLYDPQQPSSEMAGREKLEIIITILFICCMMQLGWQERGPKLQITIATSVTCPTLGHTKSISDKKTHCHNSILK